MTDSNEPSCCLMPCLVSRAGDFKSQTQHGAGQLVSTVAIERPFKGEAAPNLASEELDILRSVQAVWGILLRSYTGSDNICFRVVDGRRTQTHAQAAVYRANITDLTPILSLLETDAALLPVGSKDQLPYNTGICYNDDNDLLKCLDDNKQFAGDFSPAEGSVHEIILRHCRESPDAVAVSAWDGDMTYGELGRWSGALAAQLIRKGVKPEEFIPLCFNKSKWVVVAVLGVLRAGGAFILLETSHPVDWLQKVCESVSATVVICDPETLSLAKQLSRTTIPLIPEDEGEGLQSSRQDVSCHASSALYAVFTSGSTGRPKGIIMEHGAFCVSTKRTAGALAMGPNTRRLQFASHAFTMCNREILMMLILGGCLCIPSAHERIYDLVGFMNRHRVNYANMTPSMAVMLSPESTPGLQVLLIGGEAMGPSLLSKWVGKVKLLYGYGASETSGVAVLASDLGHDWDPHNLGFARDSALWVTEIDNPHRLAPIGAVGELLIQERGLARCYLGEEERNRQVFLHRVDWLQDPGHGPQLEQEEQEMVIDYLEKVFPDWTVALERELARYLPRYMIPSHLDFCKNMPMTKSGKVNRPKLTELVVESLTNTASGPKIGTWKSKGEIALSKAWSQTLRGQPHHGDDFFRKGGDSIAAIQLIARLHEEQLTLTVIDIFRERTFAGGSGMLQVVTRTDMPWKTIESLDELEPLSIDGGPLIQLVVKSDQPSFHLIANHTIFDAWSLNLVCEQVQHAYQGAHCSPHAFNHFIPYLRHNSGPTSALFWRRELGGFKGRQFPESPAGAMETASSDVVFGAIVTGRSAALEDISKLSGPTLALVPVRVQFSPTDSIETTLQVIQEQSSRMTPYEQTGLQHIAKAGDDVAAASNLQNVMVIQQRQRMESMRSGLFAHPMARGENYLLPFTTHPLLLVCQLGENTISLQASFDSCIISPEHARRLLRQLAHVLKQLTTLPLTTIADVSLFPIEDQKQIKQWNSHVSPSPGASIVDLIQQRCQTQPHSVAVCGDGCSLTYQDLDQYSTNLAARLRLKGAGRGQYVPLMFNKSPWASIAMVAVLRTGAAFVMLPPAYPLERLKSIVSETKAKVIVASPTCAKAGRQLSGNIIILDSPAVEHPPEGDGCSGIPQDSAPRPEDPAYVVFNSGSTGKPKGIVLHHSAVTTGIGERCKAIRMDSKSRVFQFSSYAFDVSINDNVMALVAGACICVPTESEQQNDPSTAATRLKANWAMVTPSIIRLLDPGIASTLRTFVVGGEPLTMDIVKKWEHHVHIIQIYGPAECTVLSTIQPDVTSDSDVRNIGKAVQCASWIVDPQNHDRLQPIGMAGELLLQGPTVGLGYLNDPKQTAGAFGPPPQWLPRMSAPGSSRALYRTGDLVKYAPNGSLIFVGRKDLQVKFRGQRLEPGEVESHIMSLIPGIKEVAVEMVKFNAAGNRESLVAFMCHESSMRWGLAEDRSESLDIISPGGSFYNDIAKLSSHLSERLSSYMVPTTFIPLRRMPLTLTVKVNHKLLREEIATWLPEKISAYRPQAASQVPRQRPVVAREKCIHRLVCSVLNRDGQSVSMGQDFFSLGGDSITATLLALAAKREGIHISVERIFRYQTLAQLAEESSNAVSEKSRCKDPGHNQPLAKLEKLQRLVAKVLKLRESQVTASSDFFDLGGDPITSLELAVQVKREGILIIEQDIFDNPMISALAGVAKDLDKKQNGLVQAMVCCSDEELRRELPVDILPGLVEVLPTTQFQRMSNSSMNYSYYRIHLPSGFDKPRLLWACQQLVHRHAIMRTGFFKLSSVEEVQLVLQPREVTVHEHHVQDLDAHCRHDDTVADWQDCGKPPFQMQLVTLANGRVFLVFRLGHALFDGLSIRLIGEEIASLYNGQPLPETNPLSVHLRATLALRTDAAFNT
ncbi:nonribosomal peptide synthase [Aspergillus affinis]|uniref:nonribosomal peptide synthase n=1 Tax=Aspergillus affinis TaxID=1070780 RepID=UPI0022FED851|nr:nonribosomal peptide synthase [Aspergillus affinis]KAI9035709.1 nonribosomal peptide synthase [Aspergillus affinis]